MNKFDTKAVRALLVTESKFITELLDKRNFPVAGNDDSDMMNGSSEQTSGIHSKKKAKLLAAHNKGTARARSLEELHDKLQALRGKKLGYKDKLLKKGLKNRALKKQKKDDRRGKKNLISTSVDDDREFESKPKPQKPIYNSEGKMVFSRFDFSESGFKDKVKGREERDPHKVLRKIEKQNEKLKELELKGETEKLTEIREKIAWNNALSRCEGVKVKDNPTLLKKTIKKETKRKQKSKKNWAARMEGIKNRQEERQKKRTENIEARKKHVKMNKLKRAAKRGRIIPGF